MEKLTGNILSNLFSAISCQASLEAVLKIFIVNYPKYLKKYYTDLRYQAISVGLVQYKDYFEFELLVDDCQRKSYYPMMSLLYSKYQNATSLAEQLWYKNKIRSKFKQYVRNDKQFEELNQYFLDEDEFSPSSELTTLNDFDDSANDSSAIANNTFDEKVNKIVSKITDSIEEDYFKNLESSSVGSGSKQLDGPRGDAEGTAQKAAPPLTVLEAKTTQPKASKTSTKKPTNASTKRGFG